MAQRWGGSVRHVRHHTSPGIWRQPLSAAAGQGLAAQAGPPHGAADADQEREVPPHRQLTVNVASLPPTELSPTHRCTSPGSITNCPRSL